MWSLYEKKNGKDEFLKPLKFSNGKSQEDIVNEVVNLIKKGNKIIFIKGVCGSGKSAIALNIAKELGKASIVVPIKNLQNQYEEDYSNNKRVVKNDKNMKISIIKGRQNFICPFFKDIAKKELTLDNFQSRSETCDYNFLPCKVEIKEKNSGIIMDYLNENKNIKNKNLPIKEVKRMSIAPVCPYWSPLVPAELDCNLKDVKVLKYTGLNNKKYSFYTRKQGCGYYDQYNAYIDADAIIFNRDKYKVETLLNRKPQTDVEIIDECDEFLDSFSDSGIINLNRLSFALSSLSSDNESINEDIRDIRYLAGELASITDKEMTPLMNTKVYELIRKFVENRIMDYVECDEDNYCFHVDEVAKTFYEFADETFLFFEKKDRDFIIKLVTVDLSKRFKEMVDKNKAFVLMSGTVHSENVLKDIFGLSNFEIIEAEVEMPGKISYLRTGLELNCSYSFRADKDFRKNYLLSLNKCILQAVKPALIHVVSFSDLPTEEEKKTFKLELISREQLAEEQRNSEEAIKLFKQGKKNILYTTRCNRGMDFPGDSCKSIILTKFPFPDVSSPFWKLLKKVRPEYYNEFYTDKAKREFLQRIYRGLRFKEDHIYLLSPDVRVFQTGLENL